MKKYSDPGSIKTKKIQKPVGAGFALAGFFIGSFPERIGHI